MAAVLTLRQHATFFVETNPKCHVQKCKTANAREQPRHALTAERPREDARARRPVASVSGEAGQTSASSHTFLEASDQKKSTEPSRLTSSEMIPSAMPQLPRHGVL